jgi:hypothetical protein
MSLWCNIWQYGFGCWIGFCFVWATSMASFFPTTNSMMGKAKIVILVDDIIRITWMDHNTWMNLCLWDLHMDGNNSYE